MKSKVYRCDTCGQVILAFGECEDCMTCCDEKMKTVNPNESLFAPMHLPIYIVKGCKVFVCVGEEPHPMEESHHIEWISLKTNKRYEMRQLTLKDKPRAIFYLGRGEKVEEVFAYCNVHSLWRNSTPERCPCKCKKKGK